jgi:hypothetical protein
MAPRYEGGAMASAVHRWLDSAPRRTYVYERRVMLAREVLLATLTALATVRDLRGGIAATLSLVVGLYAFEIRRERASIHARHVERGNVAPSLPAIKQDKLDRLAWHESMLAWVFPGLLALVGAAQAQSVTLAIVVGIVSTYFRAAWDLRWMPAWRLSRVTWRHREAPQ